MHLRVGARDILTLNAIFDEQTVPLGLMHGVRGVIVAIVYAVIIKDGVAGSPKGAEVPKE